MTEQAGNRLSHGQHLMGVKFNPSNNPQVDTVKQMFASLDDMVNAEFDKRAENVRPSKDENILRTLAEQQLVLAQMAVVKYLTFSEQEEQAPTV